MTVTILCAVAVVVGLILVAVLAEPWQRPRYDRAARAAKQRAGDLAEDILARIEPLDEFDAIVASELHREANGQ